MCASQELRYAELKGKLTRVKVVDAIFSVKVCAACRIQLRKKTSCPIVTPVHGSYIAIALIACASITIHSAVT